MMIGVGVIQLIIDHVFNGFTVIMNLAGRFCFPLATVAKEKHKAH